MTTSVLGQKRWFCPLRPLTRDELANDRSLLTWLRTGIALFRLGFVVAKVALLVQLGATGAPRGPIRTNNAPDLRVRASTMSRDITG
ncbi:DUF202 domain-containing protein [Nocardioides sp. WL0053]|uniref:DUF202 domain-containing protein n=1 Tax=Nocardioides jiangsuensis TaxID=2866161 RepID=A0ABS7RQJ4_9ACTN|nr:DUF202 domain-containing protein [Nocardioides jiangsuensis]